MLKQSLQQKQIQKLSPLQIQTVKLLELPLLQFEERINKELEENPVLEEDIHPEEQKNEENEDNNDDEFTLEDYISDDDDDTPAYRIASSNTRDEVREYTVVSDSDSLQQLLEEQLVFEDLDEKGVIAGRFIIGSIDSDGYLRRDLVSISNDLAFKMSIEISPKKLEKILKIIQTFDPPGVGARTLRECLLIQLKNKPPTKDIRLAGRILTDCFDDFSRKHYDKIIARFDVKEDELKGAVNEILKLNPKPGSGYENIYLKQAQQIIPDFMLESKNDEIELSLNSYNLPELRINKDYSGIIEKVASKDRLTPKDKETVLFVRQKIDAAKYFIEAVKQRQETMLNTMKAITLFQREYFATSDESKLRPMILRDISEMTGLDVTTVSRVVNSKYVQCDWGVFSLRHFFSGGIQSEMGEVSTREVKNIILECVDKEDKKNPMTDEELHQTLKDKGYNIARRTVAKYREKMNIPVARLRREI